MQNSEEKKTTGRDKSLSRRDFLAAAAGAAALGGTACAQVETVTIVPRNVVGGPGHKAPSETLNIASIGIGGRGSGVIDGVKSENIVALCDVDWRHGGGTFRKYPNAKKYRDFREMLDKEKGIDAVTVAIPDHVHAAASMMAIQMGKHCYTEKPLTHTVYEARKLAEAAREMKVATQMGNTGQASESRRLVEEWIADGAIGEVTEVHVWTDRSSKGLFDEYWPQGVTRPKDTPAAPNTLSWDLWLGPAPVRPYNPAYLPFKWRGWWDFGTGALGDIGCHAIDPIVRALRLGPPTSVQAVSTRVNTETYPLASTVQYEFPARGDGWPPVKMVWYDGGLRPMRPAELPNGRQMGANGTLYVGDKGKMLDGRLIPETKMQAYKRPDKTIPRSPGHFVEWINACKGGEPAGSNFDHAGPLTETVLLGNIALRRRFREQLTKMKLLWDSENMKITNLPEANEYVHKTYRKGWTL